MSLATDDPHWNLVTGRVPTPAFFYAVTTTGIYCRPDCAARRPRPENIRYFGSNAAAEAAGFRPCRRCRPDRPENSHAAAIIAACRMIAAAEEPPSVARLAAAACLSPFHFHRIFKAATGVTPKAFAAAERAKRVRQALAEEPSVTQAIYAAGYNASSRFYDEADAVLGMTPTALRAGGAGKTIAHASGVSSLGAVLVAATETGICSIALGDEPAALLAELTRRFPAATISEDAGLGTALAAIIALVEAPGSRLDLPLDIRGSAFQRRVWEELQKIPAGETASYTAIAARIGAPGAVRAVAGACAANTLAVAIPCHRAVRADGALAGYRWGLARKRQLLAREAGDAG